MNEFKLIVAGGRDFNNKAYLERVLLELVNEGQLKDDSVSIVSGCARGADSLALQFAIENGVKYYEFPADWVTHGKSAGFIRNKQMGDFADGLLVFWDGKSKGTKHMFEYMKDELYKPVFLYTY